LVQTSCRNIPPNDGFIPSLGKCKHAHRENISFLINIKNVAVLVEQTLEIGIKINRHGRGARKEYILIICIAGGGVQLGPLGTAATNRPIVPAPGDYDDGETGGMVGRGNRSTTRRKPVPVPLCPPQTPHAARTRTWTAAIGSQRLTA
jgi:hypothetical protein